MDELIKIFHIDWKLLIAQAVNFTIVLAVLYFFGIKPLMKIMNDRTKKIEDGVKNAEKIEKQMKEAELEKQEQINQGRQEAGKILNNAQKESEKIRQERVEKTKKETERIVMEAKKEIESRQEQMAHEVKTQLAELVLLASNKLADNILDEKKHKTLIDKTIAELQTVKLK